MTFASPMTHLLFPFESSCVLRYISLGDDERRELRRYKRSHAGTKLSIPGHSPGWWDRGLRAGLSGDLLCRSGPEGGGGRGDLEAIHTEKIGFCSSLSFNN